MLRYRNKYELGDAYFDVKYKPKIVSSCSYEKKFINVMTSQILEQLNILRHRHDIKPRV